MRKTQKSWRTQGVAVAVVLALAVVVSTAGIARATSKGLPKTITIGVLTSASLCKDAIDADQLAVQVANSTHFFGKGVKVKATVVDDQGTQAGAVTGYRTLVQSKVAGILGPCLSSAAETLAPQADANKMPQILSEESATDLIKHKYLFRGAAPQRIFADKTIDVLHAKGYKTVAMIYTSDQSDTVSLLDDAFKPELKKDGMTIVGSYAVSQTTPSISSVIAQIQQLRPQPDVIGLDAFGSVALPYLSQIRQAGVKQPIFGQIIDDYPFISGSAVAKSEGGLYYATNFGPATTKAAKNFTNAYLTEFNTPPDPGSAQEYDGAFRLFYAIKRANSVSGAAVQAALSRQKEIYGVEGSITFTQGGHEANSRGYVYWVNANGKQIQTVPK